MPGIWQTVTRGHRRIRIHRRGFTETVKVTRCHPRTVREHRIVWVTVRRHGHRVRVRRRQTSRVVVLPHVVDQTQRRVAFGQTTTVNGWVGTYSGTALAGQTVQILTAPDNGSDAFTPTATATTVANGAWTATIPAGPSRLIEATYPGATTVLSSVSGLVREIVPARIRLIRVWPRRVAWGGTVHLIGQLQGGYLPAGGALVRLRIGEGSSGLTYGVREHVGGNGRFATTYIFGAGEPASYLPFWFQLASLPMGAYPYAPADSRRLHVLVGGHPHTTTTARHRHHPRRRRKRRAD